MVRQCKIKNVIIHTADMERTVLVERVCAYHVDVIERHLRETGISLNSQIKIINGIIENLRKHGY